jgi:hypothetical protein
MKRLIYFLALIGVFCIGKYIYNEIYEHKILKSKHVNCNKIKVGMQIPQVRKILADDLKYWNTNDLHGKIEFNINKGDVPHYFLTYKPNKWAQSEFLTIYFDPLSLKVTNINCGDD